MPEFRAAANRRVGRGMLAVFVIGVGVVAAVVGANLLTHDLGRIGIGLLGTELVAIPLSIWWWRRAARDPLTRCPHCRKSIAGHHPLVVASRRCYHCGGVVLIDPDEPPDPDSEPPPLPSRYEYVEADKKHQLVALPVLLGGAIGSYIGCAGAAGVTGTLRLPDPLNVAAFGVLVAIVPVATIAVVLSLFQRAKRNPTLSCFGCGNVLAGARDIVATTRRCPKCGRTALAGRTRPEPPPHAAPPFTVAVIDQRVAARRVVFWRNWRRFGWFVGVILAAGGAYLVLGGPTEVERWLTPRVGNVWAWFVAGVGPWLALVVALIVVAVVNDAYSRAARRKYPLDCPRCGKQFLPHLAKATRCCQHCHWSIVVDA